MPRFRSGKHGTKVAGYLRDGLHNAINTFVGASRTFSERLEKAHKRPDAATETL